MIKSYLLATAAMIGMGFVSPVMAEVIEGPPPAEGTTCEGTCAQPGGQGGQWEEGPSAPVSTSTDTYVETTSTTFNQAELASGGRASDKNQSNFRAETTTTTVVTTTVEDGSWVNHGNQNPPPKTFTETTVVYDSQNTETSNKKHIKPTKP